ncbi:MAG: porphobilinogen synthase, partial [Candidatus Dormibacteria bacterium]
MPYPQDRPRRFRRTSALRRLVREARLDGRDLIAPAFVREGINNAAPIAALPGHRHETPDSVLETVEASVRAGCGAVLLFGLPQHKDAEGSGAWRDDGGVQQALRAIRRNVGADVAVIADCCLCEYTSHGHCG